MSPTSDIIYNSMLASKWVILNLWRCMTYIKAPYYGPLHRFCIFYITEWQTCINTVEFSFDFINISVCVCHHGNDPVHFYTCVHKMEIHNKLMPNVTNEINANDTLKCIFLNNIFNTYQQFTEMCPQGINLEQSTLVWVMVCLYY